MFKQLITFSVVAILIITAIFPTINAQSHKKIDTSFLNNKIPLSTNFSHGNRENIIYWILWFIMYLIEIYPEKLPDKYPRLYVFAFYTILFRELETFFLFFLSTEPDYENPYGFRITRLGLFLLTGICYLRLIFWNDFWVSIPYELGWDWEFWG
jgi:hypothetical protein